MSPFKARRIYFQSIAHASTLIADGQTINGHLRKSFSRINGELELSADALQKLDSPCMVQHGLTVMPSQPGRYVYFKTFLNELFFLARFDPNNGVANEMEDAEDLAYEAAAQFLAFMLHDYEENGICGNLFHFDLNNSKLELYGPVLDNLIGWRLTFLDIEKGLEFDYNNSDYTEDGCISETEIIYFFNEQEVQFAWNDDRKTMFGLFPTIEVWYLENGGAQIGWPSIQTDAAAPDQTAFIVSNGSPKSGYIILK